MGERGIGQGSGARARDHRGDGSALECRSDKIVAIVTLAANGEEQLARRDRARVDGVAGRHERTGIGHAGRRFEHGSGAHRRFCKCEIHCPSR